MLKRLALAAATLLLVAGAVLAVIAARFEPEHYRAEIAGALSALTGRAVAVDGPIVLGVWPLPRVVVEGLSVANPAWAKNPELLRVTRAEAVVSLRSLLSGVVNLQRLVVIGPVIALEIGTDGQSSWDFGGSRRAGPMELPGFVTEVTVERATVRYVDHRTGTDEAFGIARLTAHGDAPTAPVSFALEGALAGRPVAITGTLRSPATLFAGRPVEIGIAVRSAALEASARGRIGDALAVTGFDLAIGFAAPSLDALAPVVPAVPGLDGPVRMTARLADDGPAWRLDEIDLRVGDAVLAGHGRWQSGAPRPRLTLALESARLELGSSVVDGGGGAPAGVAAGRVIPDLTFPVDALGRLDAGLGLDVAELSVGPTRANDFSLDAALEDSHLVVKAGAIVEGGRVSAAIDFAPDGGGAVLGIHLKGEGVNLGPLVSSVHGEPLMTGGPATFDAELRGHGSSTRAVAATLRGRAHGTMGPARIRTRSLDLAGGDSVTQLAGSILPGAEGDAQTRIECAAFDLPFEGGIMRTGNALGARTERVALLAGGTVHLATEAIDLAITPRPRTGIGLGTGMLVRAVRLTGTLAEPRLGADAEGAVLAGASVGAAVATGGLSLLLQGAWERLSGEADPCALVGGRAAGKSRGARADEASAPGPGPSAGSTPVEAAGRAIEGVGKALEGLFGN